MRIIIVFGLVAVVAMAQQPTVKLLPTERDSAIVRDLLTRLADREEADTRPANYARLKNRIRDFIIQQLFRNYGWKLL